MSREYLVPAIKRAFDIIEVLAKNETGCTISDVHRTFGLPLSSAANILYTLQALGYLDRDRQTARYHLTGKLLSISRGALDRAAHLSRCHGLMQELVRESGLTGHLAVLRDGDAVYVDRVASSGFVQFSSYIGMRWPAYCSATGKILLAFLPEDQFRHYLESVTLTRLAPSTITSKTALLKQTLMFRRVGYAWEQDEGEPGVGCVAAPLFGPDRQAIAAVSLTGTSQQLSRSKTPALGALVKRYAQRMSDLLNRGA